VSPLLIIILTQLLFTSGDLWARSVLVKQGFHLSTFLAPWFIGYVVLRTIATIGQLYVLSAVKLGHSMALFGATSIIVVNVLGFLVLKETLSPQAYIGVSCAVVAFCILAFRYS
jgi:uncharacterized membrane protein